MASWNDRTVSFFFLFGTLCQLLALSIFAIGFFPSNSAIPGFANHDPPPIDPLDSPETTACLSLLYSSSPPPLLLSRLVLVVMDAWRRDFLFSAGTPMTFTKAAIEGGNGVAFVARVQAPTVTMPRIKALTAGTVPAFADAVLNVASRSHFTDDNIVDQLKRAGKRILFYGDDTWLKLFPTAFLDRSEGTVSFYVNDYTEVDDNVTRHLDGELRNLPDWDVMILHYLGLDHIGHSLGPRSPALPVKLREMDAIIERIYTSLAKSSPGEESFALMVVGDHGMTDGGQHGGSSELETAVPMVFLSPKMHGNGEFLDAAYIDQIDATSTVSLLLGTPIPQNNIGAVLFSVLFSLFAPNDKEEEDKAAIVLPSLMANTKQIARLYERTFGADDVTTNVSRALADCHSLLRRFCASSSSSSSSSSSVGKLSSEFSSCHSLHISLVHAMKRRLLTSFTDYRLPFVYAGVALSLLVTLTSVGGLWWTAFTSAGLKEQRSTLSDGFLLVAVGLHAVSLFSSSFVEEEHQTWYFFFSTYLFLLAVERFGQKNGQLKNLANNGQSMGAVFALAVLHRLLRAWNRTGDKWTLLPDVGDWLRLPENQRYLTLFGGASLFALVLIAIRSEKSNSGKMAIGKYLWPFLHTFGAIVVFISRFVLQERSVYSARLVWFLLLVLLLLTGSALPFLLLWSSLLLPLHNFPVLLGVVLQSLLLTNLRAHPLALCLATACAFFYTGNSNSLAGLDVAAGYAGLTSYQPVIVGLQMLVTTYAGPALVLATVNADVTHDRWLLTIRSLASTSVLSSLTVLRSHLFVWSVFAPKFLYEAVHLLLALLFATIRLFR